MDSCLALGSNVLLPEHIIDGEGDVHNLVVQHHGYRVTEGDKMHGKRLYINKLYVT